MASFRSLAVTVLLVACSRTSYSGGSDDGDAPANADPSSAGGEVDAALAQGLLGHWTFDDADMRWPTGVALDVSGNGNDGTLVGPPDRAGGVRGEALSFDGSTDYVDCGNGATLQPTGDTTFSAWVEARAHPGDDGDIVSKWAGNGGYVFKSSPDTGVRTFGLSINGPSGTGSTQRYSTATVALDTWYHFVAVYRTAPPAMDLYVNGSLDDGSITGPPPSQQFNGNPDPVLIGTRSDHLHSWNGRIDDVRIYGRALSADEVARLYALEAP